MTKEYIGHLGTRYKYDLNNPTNKQAYEFDFISQINDMINPNIELDRAMGQKLAGTILINKIPTLDEDKK